MGPRTDDLDIVNSFVGLDETTSAHAQVLAAVGDHEAQDGEARRPHTKGHNGEFGGHRRSVVPSA